MNIVEADNIDKIFKISFYNLQDDDFEIISEDKIEEIDIQAINKYGTNGHNGYIKKSSTDSEKEKELRKYIENNVRDIQTLIQAIKQLDKKIK